MRREGGTTLFEVLTVLAVVAVLAAIAVPSASRVRASVAGGQGARKLALVLRAAQAEAQARAGSVRIAVEPDGDYTVTGSDGATAVSGSLCASVTSNYPGDTLEFTEWGWARVPGSSSPRAGRFTVSGGMHSRDVVIQLSGCVRCP